MGAGNLKRANCETRHAFTMMVQPEAVVPHLWAVRLLKACHVAFRTCSTRFPYSSIRCFRHLTIYCPNSSIFPFSFFFFNFTQWENIILERNNNNLIRKGFVHTTLSFLRSVCAYSIYIGPFDFPFPFFYNKI